MAARASLVAPVVSPHFISTVIRASGSLNSQAGLMPLPSAQAQALQWRAVRDIVLARDSRICRACGDTCSQGEADVHHLIPRAAGGVDDPANAAPGALPEMPGFAGRNGTQNSTSSLWRTAEER